MDISKIYVRVDKHDYSGLYWLTEVKGKSYLNVSYGGLKKISKHIGSDNTIMVDQIAKTMLYELIETME